MISFPLRQIFLAYSLITKTGYGIFLLQTLYPLLLASEGNLLLLPCLFLFFCCFCFLSFHFFVFFLILSFETTSSFPKHPVREDQGPTPFHLQW
ncbi:hypothetical protein CW304_11875 [Bacillus sp. UFRGS-B20]|nr:hypothetical protein CW304_11875 [Bacillus sp. UFRGS-B20]